MRTELKIALPVYKILYSSIFMIILSLIRGISDISQIGIAMETPIAILAVVFCADVYQLESMNKRHDIFCLYSLKKRKKMIQNRLRIQVLYLFALSLIGYFLFYWKTPGNQYEIGLGKEYCLFMIAMITTIMFWGTLSMTISNLARNMWAGIGASLILWLFFNSTTGNRLLGNWNVFSYTFRTIDGTNNLTWMKGKIVPLCLVSLMIISITTILKKRG